MGLAFMDDTHAAAVAKALAHPARLHILRLLASQTECRGADVFSELPLAQSTISEHLRVLKQAELVSSRPEVSGNGMVYCLDPRVFGDFLSVVSGIASAASICNPSGRC
jgi:ArsR family transcriptional regulator